MPRKIEDLKFAEAHPGPGYVPKRLRGAKAQGIAFQNKVARYLDGLDVPFVHGGWFRFRDANGYGYCQPDHFGMAEGPAGEYIVLIEDKLTQKLVGAEAQLRNLYGPVLAHVYRKPVIYIQAFKRIRSLPMDQIDCPMEAVKRGPGPTYSWHYLG